MRVVHSVLHPDDLAQIVASEYQMPEPVFVSLMRRGFNDTYRVRDDSGKLHVLRVYSRDKYWISSESDFRFEVELLDYLADVGVPVSRPYKRRTGDMLGRLVAPEGERVFAVFSYADGSPANHLDLEQRHALGAAIGKLHEAMDRFVIKQGRYHLDLELLVSTPLAAIENYVPEGQRDDFRELEAISNKLKGHITALRLPKKAYGLIHVDIHMSNLHVVPTGAPILFDFDHCGYGWRVYDLTHVCWAPPSSTDEERDLAKATLDGYLSVRALTDAEIESLPVFAACRVLWDTGDMLRAAHRQGDSWALSDLCGRTLKRVNSILAPLM